MSKKSFTEKEVQYLKENTYVKNVSIKANTYTDKSEFISSLNIPMEE